MKVKENGNHLNTGFLSTGELCRVLSEYGQLKTAYDLLLQDTCPSWLYQVKKGATTIWEKWDGIDEDGKPDKSLNHYAYGSIAGWLIDSVCGIRTEGGKITIAPKPDRRLGFAEAVYESPAGTIRSEWRYEGDVCIFTITLPEDVAAELYFPDETSCEIAGGTFRYRMA